MEINCIVYVAITSWYKVNDIKYQAKATATTKEAYKPKWLKDIEKSIFECRRFISQCVAELERIKRNGRATKKLLRNRRCMEAELGNISVYSLTKHIMKLKTRLHRMTRTRKRKLKNQLARDYNNSFHNNQGRVFNEFKSIIAEQTDEYPIFKKLEKKRIFFLQ